MDERMWELPTTFQHFRAVILVHERITESVVSDLVYFLQQTEGEEEKYIYLTLID